MTYKKKGNYLVLVVTASLSLIFCTISLPKFYYDSSFPNFESDVEDLEFLKHLKVEEMNALLMHKHLLILPKYEAGNRGIILACKNIMSPRRYGQFKIYPMKTLPNYIKIFLDDGVRAFRNLKYRIVKADSFELEIVINSEVEVNRMWKNSRFIECLGLNVSDAKRIIPESYVTDLGKFRDYVERFNSTIFLFCGTLLAIVTGVTLGWYRECSFIRDTTDVDFAMKIEQLNDDMLEDIQNSTIMRLYWILGKKEDSLELSVYMKKIKIDLFFLYHNTSFDWIGGMVVPKKEKLRWLYPYIDELCTADLLGILFNVPCNVDDVLTADYGENWRVPYNTSVFQWDRSSKNVHRVGFWSLLEWKQVYRKFS